jgi:hypothetical protein
MRVATAFTGAVACAAAFTPAAAVAGTQRPDALLGVVNENTKCPVVSSIHLATSTGGAIPTAKSICFSGDAGPEATLTLPGTGNYFAACGGFYVGYYSGTADSGHGAHFKDTFGPGKTFLAFAHNGPIKNFTVHISAYGSNGKGTNC